ncbi:MAG: ABC transporter substrate-binding protein [Polyangiaceae bacterium]|nr:ABC transporter substrate-binding protein [Polyangiaceae bacterium]
MRLHFFSAALMVFALGATAPGCALSNIAQDDCGSNAECEAAFGLGSACAEGYCSAPKACVTGHDCRRMFGGGACVQGGCVAALPRDPTCSIMEPPDLLEKSAVGDGSHVILGGIFSLEAEFDEAQTKAVRLAVREVNRTGGTINGRPLGVIFCDNGGPDNSVEGDARKALNEHAMDYLAGTLGVPALVGPLRSSDSLTLISRALAKRYPTVIISPSATSPALTKQPDKLDPADKFGLFWRTCPSDELQGSVLATNVIPQGQKVAVIYLQDAYGEGLSTVFKEKYEAGSDPMMPSTVVTFPFDASTDRVALASSVASAQPQAVLIISVQAVDSIGILTEIAKTPVGGGAVKFYFTDGSKDDTKLLDPALPQGVKDLIQQSRGTAPARPSGPNFELFKTNLQKDFMLSADAYAFLAQSYDAGYVGAYGIAFASRAGTDYDGRQVAEGLANLSSGTMINISPTEWPAGKSELSSGPLKINLVGTSGELDFNASTGEAPGPIEIWSVAPTLGGFVTDEVVKPLGN